jgi:hypothetical protein
MWVIGYDSSDTEDILNQAKTYWGYRHGSPLLSIPAIWVPADWIGVIHKNISEYADLYFAFLNDTENRLTPKRLSNQDEIPQDLNEVLQSLTEKDIALAVEFTYHDNWSTNTVQRLRIIYDCISLGIPTVYAMPSFGIALRGISRRGDNAVETREIREKIGSYCESLVENNEPVTIKNIEKMMRRNNPKLRINIAGMSKMERNEPDPKVPLFCKTMQDSFNVPCATVQLGGVFNPAPNYAKLSGCQLKPIFDLIKGCLSYVEKTGRIPDTKSGLFDKSNDIDESLIALSPPSVGGRNRSLIWDNYHAATGFPNGSLAVAEKNPKRKSCQNYYSLHSPRIADIYMLNPKNGFGGDFNEWIALQKKMRKKKRKFGKLDSRTIPKELKSRELIVTYYVKEYEGGIKGEPIWHNLNERTYSSKLILIDMCAIRNSKKIQGRPRAMATSMKDRRHLLAVDLPISSKVLFKECESNARLRTFADFADILVLDDGGYLGNIWWKDGSPIKIF